MNTVLPRLIRILLAVSALATLGRVGARASDQKVDINPELNGAFMHPDGPWDGRTILFLHGFADDMDGAGDLTKKAAVELARTGIASLRINFRGEGDRKRTDLHSTLSLRKEDAEAAYAYMVNQPGVDSRRLGVVGWSLGSATEIMVLGAHPLWFKSGMVWSSLVGDIGKFALTMPGAQQALSEGKTVQNGGWKTITTYRDFYESFKGIDLDVLLGKYKGSFLALRGSNDFLPHLDEELLKSAGGKDVESMMIGGADHIFNVLDDKNSKADRAIGLTVTWFYRTL